MTAIAIDDEPLALSIISKYAQRLEDVSLSLYTDPVEGFEAVCNSRPDVLFLDIEMNGVSGIDLAAKLPYGTCLVFTTAYAHFALEGFELSAVDFLHKPFSFDRFSTAVQKVRDILRLRSLSPQIGMVEGEIVVKSDYQNVNIRLSEIQYVESMDNYVKIFVADGNVIVTQMSMKDLLELLPDEEFVRIHKSYIVPLKKVVRYTRRMVIIQFHSLELPVGRVYSDNFLRMIQGASC